MRMKSVATFVITFMAVSLWGMKVYAAPDVSAESCILIHADSGQVLYNKNEDEHKLIASTTKIMTALVALENSSPDDIVYIKPEYTNIEGSSMYLKAGEKYSLKELLYGLLLSSGNDAATAIAYHCGGTIEEFASMMNDKAKSLGLCGTCFKNPHGLDADGHYSTAEDLAIIMAEAIKNPVFCEIAGTKSCEVKGKTLVNHNKLLWSYPGMIAGKTGYTMAAGRSLVSCAQRDGLKLICVTLSAPDDWKDHTNLYDWAFNNYEYIALVPEGPICHIPVISGERESVGISADAVYTAIIPKDFPLSFSLELPPFVYAGVCAGDCAGKIFLKAGETVIGEYPLIYTESVPLADTVKLSVWARLKRAWFLSNKYGYIFSGTD